MTSIALLSLANHDIQNDARILRQAEYLGKFYDVHIISYGRKNEPIPVEVKSLHIVGTLYKDRWKRQLKTAFFLPLGRLFPKWAYDQWYWSRPGHREMLKILLAIKPDIIHANDWWTMPVAADAAKITGSKLVVDFHEYALKEFSNAWWLFLYQPLVQKMLDRYIHQFHASVCVTQAMADRYRDEYSISPVAVMNAPKLKDRILFKPTDAADIRVIYHGMASKQRPPEAIVDLIPHLDARFSMHFMLLGNPSYLLKIKKYAQKIAPGRITFHSPVKPANILDEMQKYDLGIYLVKPYSDNIYLTVPNKFFDFFSAGLAQVTTAMPEMVRMINRFHFGVAVDSQDIVEISKAINLLTCDQIDQMKMNALKARSSLNADTEMEKLVNLYRELLN